VRLRVPRRARALMRFSGMPHRPKPPSRMLAPSGTRATAASALEILAGTTTSSGAAARPPRTHLVADVFDGVLGRSPWTEELAGAEAQERLLVFPRYDAAAGHEHLAGTLLSQELKNAREERHVRSRKNGQGDDVDVLLHGRAHDHLGRLVQARVD